MSDQQIDAPVVTNQERDRRYNMEPGLIEVPGTPYALEMSKFNKPYQYRPFPKMVYRAERRNGKAACMESAPDRYDFQDDRAFMMAEESARVFTDRCQLTVHDDVELSRALEMGYREGPKEAVEFLTSRENLHSKEIAHRNYDDRNLSERAKAEIADAENETGEPVAEVKEKRLVRKR